jgi:hypothetical protein
MMQYLPKPWLITILAFALAAIASSAHGADCRGQIGAGTTVTGKTAYDPYSPAEIADSYQIGIANTGADPCLYALVFRSKAVQPKLGGTLVYSLADGSNAALLTNAPPAMAPAARLRDPLPPAATAQIEFRLLIPRGQDAAPAGAYRDTLDLELYALDQSGRLSGAPLQTTTLSIGYAVQRVLSVNIKGADTTTTMGFGVLAKGQQRTVEIQTRSNQSYQLDVSSDHHGVLALMPKVPGQEWTVPYAATLGGRPLDLAGGASLVDFPPTRPESDASHSLTISIGDVGQKRAGRYEDVITVEIRAGVP